MQVKLLHDLVEELAGQDTGRIVEILFGKKDVNEFLISKKMELTINQVRNILYKLSADGLVSFIRKKDKRKGWYIYYWTLKTEKCLVKLEQSLLKKIENLHELLNSRETKRFYTCKSCVIEVGEEKALEHGFTCEECAEVYELSDNSGSIRDTKAKITRREKELKLISTELEIIREKERKKRLRADKKEAKELAAKKELLKAARAAARKKVAKKTVKKVKKVTKKKIVKKVRKKVVKKVKKKVAKKAVKKKPVKKVKKPVKKAKKKTVKRTLRKLFSKK
jgi:transcription factor E